MPWLGPGFIYCIHEDAEQVLRRELARLNFSVFALAGREVRDANSLHSELARTFSFPDYYGRNWDAFNDCFDDPALPRRSALLWTHAEQLAQADLKAFAEAVAVFREAADALSRDGRQFELMLLGTGPGFRRPAEPVDPAWRRLPL
jgi:RNAse (barnase) inhibitor barstar